MMHCMWDMLEGKLCLSEVVRRVLLYVLAAVVDRLCSLRSAGGAGDVGGARDVEVAGVDAPCIVLYFGGCEA